MDSNEFIKDARVAHLATVDGLGQPMVVPVCFVFDGTFIYSPIDEKPKQVEPTRLRRLRNINENPRVSMVVDEYSEDWNKLAHVIVSGVASIISPFEQADEHKHAVILLREKYPQYQSMKLEESPDH